MSSPRRNHRAIVQVNTKTANHRETSHTLATIADLSALIANEKARHEGVTSITIIIVFGEPVVIIAEEAACA